MNLDALTPAVLTELTNVGTVRRATREAESTEIAWSTEGEVVIATAADGVVCRLSNAHFADWECSCPAGGRCRHLVRAVLVWQRDHADAPGAAGPDEPGTQGVAGDVAPAPADVAGAEAAPAADVEALFTARTRREGERALAEGLIARVSRRPRLVVRLHHPVELSVRYPVGSDPRYARCECGVSACVHLFLAQRAAELLPPDSPGGLVTAGALPTWAADLAPEGDLRAPWRAWLHQLLDAGLGAADPLIGGAVRIASVWEDAGLVHPAAALREIVEQLEHQRAHDSQLSPERLLTLIGEVEARLRSLARGDSPVPAPVVAGRADAEVRGESARLLGIGAEYVHVGGWHSLRAYVLDVRTGAVSHLAVEREDAEGHLVTVADLAGTRRGGATVTEWALGNAVVPGYRRRGDLLVLGRQRAGVAPSARLDLTTTAAVLPAGLAEVEAQLPDLPWPLGPRRRTDGVLACPVAGVDDVHRDTAASCVRATLVDAEGLRADLRLDWSPRTGAGAHLLHDVLSTAAPVAVAGRWRRTEGRLVVTPTAVWTADGVVLPQANHALGVDLPSSSAVPATALDPWAASLAELGDALGRLLVLGARRGSASVEPQLLALAERLSARGLVRLGDTARGVGRALPRPAERVEAVAEACVLLAFAT